MPLMLAQLDPGSVVLTVVKRTMVASPAVLQQRIFKTCIKQQCKGGKTVLIMTETKWKNNLNFVKDAPMICVNFMIIAIIVSDRKIGSITFILSLILSNDIHLKCCCKHLKLRQ
jgi:hypothetical protein